MATEHDTDDLDIQTFKIYHEDEAEVAAANKALEEQEQAKNNKGKKPEKKSLFSFGSKDKKQVPPTKTNKKPEVKKVEKKVKSQGMSDSTKGIIIGAVLLVIFIVIDQMGFLG